MTTMLNKFILLLSAFVSFQVSGTAQERIPLNPSVYDSWNNLERPMVSTNGKQISYEINPQSGDGFLVLVHPGSANDTIKRAAEAVFSPENDFIAYKIKPLFIEMRKAKLDGKKKDDLPKDSLGIRSFNHHTFKYAALKSFSVPAEKGNFVAALIGTPKAEISDSAATDTLLSNQQKASTHTTDKQTSGCCKKGKTETYTLKLIFPADSLIYSRDSVTLFAASENGKALAWVTYSCDSIPVSSINLFNIGKKSAVEVFRANGYISNPALDSTGTRLAFLQSSDTIDAKRYRLYYYNQGLKLAVDTVSEQLEAGMGPSANGKVWFSQDGSKLYFGIAENPRPEPKDTLTPDEKSQVDVWNWRDPLLQPQQLKQLENEKKRTFLSVYYTADNRIVQLAGKLVKEVRTGYKGNGKLALGFNEDPYLKETSWKEASFRDVYLINTLTGSRDLLLTRFDGPVSLSTTQNYLAWYNKSDSLWYTMDLRNKIPVRHSAGKSIAFYDTEYDQPAVPGPEGSAGWTGNDRYFIVYDHFDLWGLDPTGSSKPVNLTRGEGRLKNQKFRIVNLNKNVAYIGNRNVFLLKLFDLTTMDAGFCKLVTDRKPGLTVLEKGPYKYSDPVSASGSSSVCFTRGNFREYPDLWLASTDFKKQQRLSVANPRQKNYLWGSAELFNWTLPDGKPGAGLLYKPEGFDPNKKYPMLVYFYEKYSNQLNQHYVPKPSRSIISPTFCSSNGYVVFIPDITYRTGYPGQSALEAVVSGTKAVSAMGFVDTTRMGIQGQSWGGYETAWLVTRTCIYRAAMAGAPVSNMTSAYGGIRWESGMVREFQYEEGQSRIGATLWERPDLYIENSPLFSADKIETPLLIMSNDGDGAVPWYQGIELFTALRRLNKPAWLLNYNGDEHNLSRRANMKDLDLRMMQFFDHYLKDAPAPEWMVNGIPATEKGKNNGFEPAE